MLSIRSFQSLTQSLSTFQCSRFVASHNKTLFQCSHFAASHSTTSMTALSPDFRVAIVGAGPAGFYTAKYLLSGMENHKVGIDMFDELPTPYGLVRSGVAPDHPEVKNVQNDFAKIANDGSCRFLGNVRFGEDISPSELISYYDAVVLTYGASSNDKLNITGNELEGIYSARTFVNWYNGHPDFTNCQFDLDRCENAVVIGQGNVAVDVARILSVQMDHLEKTDITENALDALSNSTLKNIYMVGRRGPAQAAFTIKEFRELTRLKGVQLALSSEEIEKGSNEESLLEVNGHRAKKRKFALIEKVSAAKQSQNTKNKKLDVRFFLNPSQYLSDVDINATNKKVSSVEFDVTTLTGDAESQKAVISGEKERIKADLVFESIGYRSVEVAGVPFDSKRGIVPNQKGRVTEVNGKEIVDRLYVSGWLKRGPTGIIGTNIPDARQTVQVVIEDLLKKEPQQERKDKDIIDLLKSRGVEVVDDEGWKNIDDEETKRGEKKGKPREKITNVEEMLKFTR